jgi:hypothetical protein
MATNGPLLSQREREEVVHYLFSLPLGEKGPIAALSAQQWEVRDGADTHEA